jgi:hypothetical protein
LHGVEGGQERLAAILGCEHLSGQYPALTEVKVDEAAGRLRVADAGLEVGLGLQLPHHGVQEPPVLLKLLIIIGESFYLSY